MKKFKFSLEKMLKYQDQILDEQKNKLGALTAIVNGIVSHIEQLENGFSDVCRKKAEKQAEGITISEIREFEFQLDNIRKQIKQLHIDLEKAQRDVDKQILVVVEADREVTKLEKLEEKQLEEYQLKVAKSEEYAIEEFISSKSIRSTV